MTAQEGAERARQFSHAIRKNCVSGRWMRTAVDQHGCGGAREYDTFDQANAGGPALEDECRSAALDVRGPAADRRPEPAP